jgi:hypothetical protein
MNCSFVLQSLQTNVAHGACTTPGGESGHCRHLRFCVLDVFTASYGPFLPYFCRINRSVRHYCCERCSVGKWEVVTTSDVANLLHWSITACQLDPPDTLSHVPNWQEFKNSVAVELGLLYSQPLTNSHFHLILTIGDLPNVAVGGPNFIPRFFY